MADTQKSRIRSRQKGPQSINTQSQKENLTQSFIGVTSLATNRQALENLVEKMQACGGDQCRGVLLTAGGDQCPRVQLLRAQEQGGVRGSLERACCLFPGLYAGCKWRRGVRGSLSEGGIEQKG